MPFRSDFSRVYKQAAFVLFIGSREQLSIKHSCLHDLLWKAMLRDLLWVISSCYINNSILDEICDIISCAFSSLTLKFSCRQWPRTRSIHL